MTWPWWLTWDWFVGGSLSWLPHAYPIEFAQFLIAHLGLSLSVVGVWQAYVDREVVRLAGINGTRLASAQRNLFEEAARLVMHLAFVVNAWVLVRYAPPGIGVALTDDRLFQLLVTRTATTFVIVVLTYKSYRDLRDRARIRRMLATRDHPQTRAGDR